MFSYIYTDGSNNHRGLTYYVTSKTEEGINKLAIDYIRGMLIDHGAPQGSQLLQAAMAAIDAKDTQKAIEAWNEFATSELKQTVALHQIQPVTLVE